jgi:hypothetical protein
MSERRLLQKVSPPPPVKPLFRVQQYLVELKVSAILLRELLVEVKELVVMLALISFFVWGVLALFRHLHG